MITITIGRDEANRIILRDESLLTSNFHAELRIKEDGSLFLYDRSVNGSFVNGIKIPKHTEFPLYRGNEVVFANAAKLDWSQVPDVAASADTFKLLSIGRNNDNDIRPGQDSGISRYHAILRITKTGKYFLSDTSSNGTYVNGTRIPSLTEYEIKRGDKIRFSGENLNWSEVPHPPGKPVSYKKYAVPAGFAAALILLIVLFTKFVGKVDVYERYKDAVVLIRHEYYYQVDFGDVDELYAIIRINKKGQKETYFSDDRPNPSAIYGTGFFISKDGKLISNRHVAQPWGEDMKYVTADAEAYLNYQKGVLYDKLSQAVQQNNSALIAKLKPLYYAYSNLQKSDIKVYGVSSFIGIGLNNTYIKSISDFIPCTTLKVAQEDRVDLSLLQTTGKTLPPKIKDIVDVNNALDDNGLKPGIKIFIIGFPEGLDFANTSQGIKDNFQNGQITRESDKIEIYHNIPTTHGASGSPLFDEDGRLAGVNWGGTGVQGFNFAIVGNQVKKLVSKQD